MVNSLLRIAIVKNQIMKSPVMAYLALSLAFSWDIWDRSLVIPGV